MLLRITVFVMMSLGLLGFGTVAWMSLQPPPPVEVAKEAPPAPVVQETILVAARELPAGSLVKPDDIGTLQVPHDKIPDGASLDSSTSRHQLAGSMVRRRVAANETLLPRDLLRPGDHGFLAAVLGAGMRAVTIGVDAITGTAGLIWPGDHVDVLLTHQIDEPNRPAVRRVAAETVLRDVRVIAIDQQLVQGAAPGTADAKPATTVTLEVTSLQSERVSVAGRLGRLSLVVRSAQPAEATVADVKPGDVKIGPDGQPEKGADAATPDANKPGTNTASNDKNPGERTTADKSGSGDTPAGDNPDGTAGDKKITWAGDVSPALAYEPPVIRNIPTIVRVYRGSGNDGQEYKF